MGENRPALIRRGRRLKMVEELTQQKKIRTNRCFCLRTPPWFGEKSGVGWRESDRESHQSKKSTQSAR